MNGRDIVVVGASAGGVEALPRVVGALPADFPASVFIVQHVAALAESYLPSILNRAAALRAVNPRDKQRIERGMIYVAPPDQHLWLENGHVRVTGGPRVNRHRPAVDPLFETAAHIYKQRVVGVILTGSLGDGAAGLHTVKQCGGVAVVQDPADAMVPSMPENALRYVEPDYLLPLDKISAVLGQLAGTRFKKKRITCPKMRFSMEQRSYAPDEMEKKMGPPTSIICPDCGGPLWELRNGKVVRYRCLTGHLFSPESLLDGEKEELERALWTATKVLEERATLLRTMRLEADERRNLRTAKSFEDRANRLQAQAETIRKIAKKLDRC
jgi:two-component system, chemotaxis family, protein-glutamate methylesterase/glutaminase